MSINEESPSNNLRLKEDILSMCVCVCLGGAWEAVPKNPECRHRSSRCKGWPGESHVLCHRSMLQNPYFHDPKSLTSGHRCLTLSGHYSSNSFSKLFVCLGQRTCALAPSSHIYLFVPWVNELASSAGCKSSWTLSFLQIIHWNSGIIHFVSYFPCTLVHSPVRLRVSSTLELHYNAPRYNAKSNTMLILLRSQMIFTENHRGARQKRNSPIFLHIIVF